MGLETAGAGGGTPALSRVVVPSSWRGWFVDSSAVTSFGDVSFRSPPVWEPDPSFLAAPVNSGQGMRAAPAAGGRAAGAMAPLPGPWHRCRGIPAGCSRPGHAPLPPGEGKSLRFSLEKGLGTAHRPATKRFSAQLSLAPDFPSHSKKKHFKGLFFFFPAGW